MKKPVYLVLCFLLQASFGFGAEGTSNNRPQAADKPSALQGDELGKNFECLSSGPAILTICTEEMAITTEIIAFDQNTPASGDDISNVVDNLQKVGLPSQACCDLAAAFNKSACHCDAVLSRLLPEVGVAFPALMSIFDVMERSCGNFQTRTCM